MIVCRAGVVAAFLLLFLVATATAGPLLCDHCRRPIQGTYTIFNGLNLHDSCFANHYAHYCTICGGIINGEFVYNSWGDTVHAHHANEYPMCEYCGRLMAEKLTGAGTRYEDGRQVCGNCLATAVTRTADAERLLDTALIELRRHGIGVERHFKLKLVDKSEMSRIAAGNHRQVMGYTELKERSSFLGLVRDSKLKVYVLSGMPRDLLLGVLAHEMMHVWLFTNAPREMQEMLCEGSCEYASYLVLKDRRGAYARYYLNEQANDSDLIYGHGFREVSDYVRAVGIMRWLEYLRSHADPPWN